MLFALYLQFHGDYGPGGGFQAGVSFAALLAVAIGHTFNYDRDYHIPAEEVERVEAERTRMLASHV